MDKIRILIIYCLLFSVVPIYSQQVNLKEIEQKANKGDAEAQYKLGEHYFNQGDFSKAFEWFKKSASNENDKAINYLGYLFETGKGVEKDLSSALKYYKLAADKGNRVAMNNVGIFYYFGKGVTIDYVKASEWYTKSAEKNYPKAQYRLANLYVEGNGVEADTLKAIDLYTQAANNNYTSAQTELTWCYYKGIGVNQDNKKTIYWAKKAANNGNKWAMDFLGDEYRDGEIIEQDIQKSIGFYQKAAQLGYVNSQFSLSVLLYADSEKFGTEKKLDSAIYWCKKAAQQNDAYAINYLGVLYLCLDSIDLNDTKFRDPSKDYFSKNCFRAWYCFVKTAISDEKELNYHGFQNMSQMEIFWDNAKNHWIWLYLSYLNGNPKITKKMLEKNNYYWDNIQIQMFVNDYKVRLQNELKKYSIYGAF
jgi:TPR repeat protein